MSCDNELNNAREVTNCPADVDLQDHLKQLVEIRNAAEKLVRCKGRYHSELNYRALAALFGVTTPDLPPLDSETPTTDSILRAAEARARIEGINFAASRLAAAYKQGFIDKPLSEVFDVVRMILSAKEDLVTPGEDGLSGEYAEQALKDWEAELSEGKA